MKKLNLFLKKLVLIFLMGIPSVMAVRPDELLNRIQDIISNLPFYEQALTFIALLILFLSVFRVGGTNMARTFNWGNDSNNANNAISVTLALIGTLSSYVFLSRKGVYIFHPILSKVMLMVLMGLLIYGFFIRFRGDGELGRVGRFITAFTIVATYHVIQWLFFSEFPQNLGTVLSWIITGIYGIAIVYMIIISFSILSEIIRGNRNDDDDDGDDDDDDDDDDGPEESYAIKIQQLSDLIARLSERYARLIEIGSQMRELLEQSREHPYDYDDNGGIPIDLMNEFNQIVDNINQIIGSINNIITDFSDVRERIPREESNRLASLMEQYAELSVEIAEYVRSIREEISGE